MSQHTISPEISHPPVHSEGTGRIWKVFWVLSALTIVELALGYFLYAKADSMSHVAVLSTKIVIGVLTVLKAYYIVSVFMHLGDEIRNMIMTITVPLVLFIWFIIAFLWDGNSWKNLRNTNAGSRPSIEKVQTPVKQGAKD
ncbi:cytochrome C oxidase subunit IV family protein [Ferruginibacter yonginensis]|uniref:Cytochrome C oxidase subunit IV family protein n=1 Tax=Ferruginibacter yonginensis TaxID=1310416 RepID=A0ABV8QTQ3_9BACT